MKRATQLIVKHTSIAEVSKKIVSEVNETLSKQQKEYCKKSILACRPTHSHSCLTDLRQQLAAIQRELQQLNRTPASDPTPASGASLPPSELDDDEQQEADDLAELKRKQFRRSSCQPLSVCGILTDNWAQARSKPWSLARRSARPAFASGDACAGFSQARSNTASSAHTCVVIHIAPSLCPNSL